jgi:hypothetical protein
VNFSDNFRYAGAFSGLPVSGGAYSFTLLDAVGEPIPGATITDIWLACLVDAPRNVSATVDAGGILVAWEPVMPVPGFDPSGSPSLGFYQIELSSEIGGGSAYGANGIHTIFHLIPKAGFSGFAPGSPDGNDFGNSLLELADGTYGFSVIAFAQAAPGSVAGGLECQVRASAERIRLEKTDAAFTIIR